MAELDLPRHRGLSVVCTQAADYHAQRAHADFVVAQYLEYVAYLLHLIPRSLRSQASSAVVCRHEVIGQHGDFLKVSGVRSRAVKKLTVRLDDDVAETFAAFCATAGVSQQGALEAAVLTTCERFELNERKAPELWADLEVDATGRWLGNIGLARSLDASRRGRKGHSA